MKSVHSDWAVFGARTRTSFSALAACAFAVGCAGAASDDNWDESLGDISSSLQAPAVCMLGALPALPRVDASASSVEAPWLAPGFAIDNDPNTRWSSAFSDPQWLRIDLGAVRYIDTVVLNWETASSARYDIDVSNDGVSWRTVRRINYSMPGAQLANHVGLSARGRYLRIASHQRTTEWGVSLFDVSVLGDPNGACTQPGAVRLDAGHSGRSLDVRDWSTADGATVQQWGYGGGNNQKWIVTRVGDNLYEIKSLFSGKCLDVAGNSTADGARLQQWTCTSAPNQRFSLKRVNSAQYQIVAAHSGKCLDVSAGSSADGAAVIQWPCHNGDNQKWAVIDPMDTQTDPNNCGRAGHSCFGGACIAGVCQATLVTTAFQCATSMVASDTHAYVGDSNELQRFDLNGYNKTLQYRAQNEYIGDLQLNNGQFFWHNGRGVKRWSPSQTTPTTLYEGGSTAQLTLGGNALSFFDYETRRFISVARDLPGPGPFTVLRELEGEYSMSSAATSAHLYYVSGTSDGTRVYQVDRITRQQRVVNDPTDWIFAITAYGDTVYWNYRSASGQTGIRRLSSHPGSVVQEAVLPAHDMQSVGSPLVDGTGIYHSYYDGTNNYYYRTPHENSGVRVLVTNSYQFPFQAQNATLTRDSIVWLGTCHRYGGGWLYRLAKP